MLDTLPTLPDAEVCRIRGLDDPGKVDPDAGFGALRTERGTLPFVALEVHSRLDGLVASVEVTQAFLNCHPEPLEATYVFPLPDRAAVTRFRLEVAGRIVEGDLQERGKARQQYDQAIQAGHRAAIAEEERSGVFTMRVGNLPPGERAVVRLALVGPLPYADGEVTFRFPLVVAPRYVPGTPSTGPFVGTGSAPDTDQVPDASRISPPVLLPGFPSPVALRLTVEVPASPLAPHAFRSSLHTVVEEQGATGQRFRVHPGERLDRDFILRYRLGSDRVHTTLVVQPDDRGAEGTFLLTFVPPSLGQRRRPRDVLFVLDRSGSMSGWKMVAARRAVTRMVETLTEDDRFSVYAFDDAIETPPGFDGLSLVPGSDRQRFRAAEFLAGVDARGGTEMAAPLEKAVVELTRGGTRGDSDRVLVLITDGQVGNEDAILRTLGSRARGVRIFTLGIDRAVNAAFLRRLADLGGGSSEVVESENRLDEVMDSVHRHIGTPILTGLTLRPAGLDVIATHTVPARLPDLFPGTPVLITGRYRGTAKGSVAINARDAAGQAWATEVQAWEDGKAPLAKVWARGRVRELEDRYVVDENDRAKLEHDIVETSLRFGVLSRFTAFVAVDRAEVVNVGGQVRPITQPVEQPAGWGGQPDAMLCQVAPMAAPGAMRAPAAPAPAAVRLARVGGQHTNKSAPSRRALAMSLGDEVELAARVPAAPPAGARKQAEVPEEKPGLLKGLISTLFGTGKQDRAAASSAPVVDREPFRSRVEDLLRRLHEGAGPHEEGWHGALVAIAPDLDRLVGDLLAAGDTDPRVQHLKELSGIVATLPGEPVRDANAVHALHQSVVQALEEWLKLLPAPDSPPPAGTPSGFWK